MQDADPCREQVRHDFEAVVKTAEYEGIVGQAGAGSVHRCLGYRTIGWVRLKAWEVGDFFGEVLSGVFRYHDAIGNDIIDVVRPHRAEKANISDLDWRGPQGENSGAGMLRVAAQIDRDVDPLFARQSRHRLVGQRPDIDEFVEIGGDVSSHRVVGVRSEGETDDVEPRAIMALKKADHELRHRMVAKIGGEIADANFAVPRPRRDRPQPVVGRMLGGRVDLGRGPLQNRIGECQQRGEGCANAVAPGDSAGDVGDCRGETFPIANRQPRQEDIARLEREIRLQGRRFLLADDGFLELV